MAERTIYILLTRSGTWFSRLIHFATHDSYTHASIGLDGPDGPFYSFARKYRRLPLPAGLVEEQSTVSCLPCCLYELRVSEESYLRLRQKLWGMYLRRSHYHYSVLGVLACWFNLSFQRQHHYFCSQFVAGLLEDCGAALPKPPALVRPADLSRVKGLRTVYQGRLEELRSCPAA